MSSFRVTLAIAGSIAAAACGFDGTGTGGPESSASPTDPGARAGASGTGGQAALPPPSAAAPTDAGPGPSTPVNPCSDPTLSFDGADDFATVADSSELDLPNDFTVEAWIKPGTKAATSLEMDIVSHHDALASRGWVMLVKDGRVEIVVYGNENFASKGYSAGNSGAAYVVAGKWAHVAGTRQGDTLRIYYDGVLRDTQQLSFWFGRDTYSGALRLGRAAYVNDFYFQGELDDVRLSDIARYTGANAPKPTTALSLDASTIAAWRFDEASGAALVDSTSDHDGSMAPDSTAPARLASTCISSR